MPFPCTTLALIGCLAASFKLDRSSSGLRIALYAWLVELILIAAPLLRFRVEYSARADVFVALCLLAQTAGYLILRGSGRPQSVTPPNTKTDRAWGKEIHLAIALALVGIMGNVLLLLSANVSLNFAALLLDLQDIRTGVFEDLEAQQASLASVAGGYLASASFLSIVGAAYFSVSASIPERFQAAMRIHRWLAVSNLILIILVALFVYAGRAAIVNVFVLLALALVLRGRPLFRLTVRRVVIGAVVLGLGFFFATSWLVAREETDDPALILEATQRAGYHPLVESAAEDSESLNLLLVSIGYFASPLPTLSYYLEQDDIPGPFWGEYSYPLLARNVHRIIGTRDPPTWVDVRHEIFWPLERAGYEGNVWATWLRDLYVDFGYLGTLAYLFSFGALVAFARNRFERTGSLPWHYLEVLGAFVMAFGAFVSTTWSAPIYTAFFLALAALVIVNLTPNTERYPRLAALAQRRNDPVLLKESIGQ